MKEIQKIVGLFEGEGCIGIAACGKRLIPYIEFSNTNKDLIDFWKKECPYFLEYEKRQQGLGTKKIWKLCLRKYSNLERFLLEIEDNLITAKKREQVKLMLELIQLRKPFLSKKTINSHKGVAWTYSKREYEIYVHIKELNDKGR